MIVVIMFLENNRPTMVENVEQWIIVEDIDICESSIGLGHQEC